MIRIVGGFFVLMVMISAGTVYSLKETTERLEARKQQLFARILQDRSAIKVLRAEMAYLSRPERLQKLSRRFLALSPMRPDQMADSLEAIAGRDDVLHVSLPVDSFPLLLPREKPHFTAKKYNRPLVKAVSSGDRKQIVRKITLHKTSFYERLDHKLDLKTGDGE